MKITKNTQFNEVFVEDTCDNGLKIIVWHKPEFKTTSCLFATPYGSLDSTQITDDQRVIQFPEGIAHFLEHKLFESEHGDVMNQYAALGANVNAFTSYNETVYYFDTSSSAIEEPINLLLDFVQDLQITEESVEKEKGIITQELNMYLEMPDSRLIFETFKSMYKNHPIKNDIGGSSESVNRTTKENLEDCYRYNYHPAKMMFIAVTPMEPEKVIAIIKENQDKKTFTQYTPIHRYFEKESDEVYCKEKTIKMDVHNQKVALGLKLPTTIINDHERVKFDWALRFLFESHFTSMNTDYQNWLTNHEITHYFDYETDISKDFALALFLDEGVDDQKLLEFVQRELHSLQEKGISENSLLQLKNRSLGETLAVFNQPDVISVQYFRHELTGVNFFDTINIIKNLTVHDCMDVMKLVDTTQISKTIIKSE